MTTLSFLPTVRAPVPRPRQRTVSDGPQDSTVEEEDIYTDNSPGFTQPPAPRRVAWGDNVSHGQGYEGLQSMGFTPAHTQSVPVAMNKVASQRELALNQVRE